MTKQLKKELFSLAEKNNVKGIETFVSNNRKAFEGGNTVLDLFDALAIANESEVGNNFLEKFNKERKRRLGIDKKDDSQDVKMISKATREMFFADTQPETDPETGEELSEEEKKANEKFATTIAETGGGLNVMGSIIATNVRTVIDKYFYNSPIMKVITLLDNKDANAEVITDFTNERLGASTGESTSGTAADNTTVSDTIQPTIRLVDKIELSSLFREAVSPTTFAKMIAKMERAIQRQLEIQIIGTVGTTTNGTNQFYSILNNLGNTGGNRGAMPEVLPLSGTAGGVVNHVDAVNYVISRLPLYDAADIATLSIACNFPTWGKLMRTIDANVNYYFDKETKQIVSLLGNVNVVIVQSMPDDQVLVGDFSNYQVKLLRDPQLKVYSYEDKDVLVMDTFGDGTPSMSYKAILSKNGFRTFTLKANYAV